MEPQRIRTQLVILAMQLAEPPTVANVGDDAATRRRDLPKWLETLPDDDSQLVELASVIENDEHWTEVAAQVLAESPGQLQMWDQTGGYRPFVDEVLSFARVPRQ